MTQPPIERPWDAPPPVKAKMKTRDKVALWSLLPAAAVLAFVGFKLSPSPKPAASAPAYTPPAQVVTHVSWVPAGFQESPDPTVAYRWAADGAFSCKSYDDVCNAIEVVSQYGCPGGVFVEMALTNSSGTLNGSSNEIGPAIGPGDHAIITVGFIDPGAATQTRLTQVSCMG